MLSIRGTGREDDLRQSLIEMSLTSELTKSDKGLYHVQICPAYGEDARMTDADWERAADILEQAAEYVGQKRAIVLHDKNGKVHAHVVWERYDHDKGIMKPNKFSRLAQDRARVQMEKEFEHSRTPDRNEHRPEMKLYLTDTWQQTRDADSFMQTISAKGYVIAAGTQRPYMVIDDSGRSFDLVRQLAGVRTKEVRERFKMTKLLKEKEAIAFHRASSPKSKKVNDHIENAVNDSEQSMLVNKRKVMSLSFNFQMEADELDPKILPVVSKMSETEMRKKEAIEKMKRERLEKARGFRENEQDLML